MNGRDAFQPRFEIFRQVLVGRVHVGELRAAERLAVALGDLDAVEHVGECDLARI